jgi:integrase
MATAKKLPSGRWRVQVYSHTDLSGKKVYKSFTAGTKKEAEYMAAEFSNDNKDRINATPNNTKFEDAVANYIKSKEDVLSPSTVRGYTIIADNAYEMINDMCLSDIDNNVIQKLINVNSKSYSLKSLKNQFGLLSATMHMYHISVDTPTYPQKKQKQLLVPNKAEIEKIMQVLKGRPDIECQILLALTCSLRQSEIFALQVKNIRDGFVYVDGAVVPDKNGKYVYKDTNKTQKSTRRVKLPEYLNTRLQEECAGKSPDDRIFEGTDRALYLRFQRMLKANGLPEFSVHAMRHAFAALMHDAGLSDQAILAMGGWQTDNVMKSVYRYAFEDEVEQEKDKVNTYFDSQLKKVNIFCPLPVHGDG